MSRLRYHLAISFTYLLPSILGWFGMSLGSLEIASCWAVSYGACSCEPQDSVDDSADDSAKLEHFEKYVRPLLVENCYECHSSETEASGGLLLDSAQGWRSGGRSGPALIPEDARSSLLMRVVYYDDPHLRMPPNAKLKPDQIEHLRRWIDEGALDPRVALGEVRSNNAETEQVERPLKAVSPMHRMDAEGHWAYQPLSMPPSLGAERDHTQNPIDFLIEAKLRQEMMSPLPQASPEVLIRRISFDLHGLPPDETVRANYLSNPSPEAFASIVDEMLRSRRFAERFARHWLDVARYAESLTLRGFILPDAWRYRDYCIDSFAQDKPIDQFLREQIAGDLMAHQVSSGASLSQRQSEQIAAMFLLLGNHNLEEQDKQQLEMDVVDEQLDTMGKVILGQTLGCARCHDHKFDPIPTRDYYALAGILKSSRVLQHENVSKWVERPLPLTPSEMDQYAAWEEERASLQTKIAEMQKRQPAVKGVVDPKQLKGIVVDDRQAKVVGKWTTSSSVKAYVGEGYLHDGQSEPGSKTVTFEPNSVPTGRYEVRLAYAYGENRSSRTSVQIHSAEGESLRIINQRQPGPIQGLWISLGTYRFEQGGQAFVIVSNQEADGHVIADAIQFLPLDADNAGADHASVHAPGEVAMELRQLEQRLQVVEEELRKRPKCMSMLVEEDATDLRIHLRGSVHALGAVAPRGFLSVLEGVVSKDLNRTNSTPDRLALAEWLTSPQQPLTPRVFVNRVWLWMMGEGIVRTPDNFGTTGLPPTHPELLDWLTQDFIEHGWSLRHLVQRIATSQAYARSLPLEATPQSELDPDNRLWWRAHEKRLDAESLRDSMLWMSGELVYETQGPQYPAKLAADYNQHHDPGCRSLFLPAFRNARHPFLVAFDAADPNLPVGQRARTTVAQQALIMLNSPWVQERAQVTAARLQREFGFDEESLMHPSDPVWRHRFLELASLRCWGRLPTESEHRLLQSYWMDEQTGDTLESRTGKVIQLMWSSLCFRYLD